VLHVSLAALALAATTLAVSGCGGSSKTESSKTPAATGTPATTAAVTAEPGKLARTELIAKAEAICARINAKRSSTTIRTHRDYGRLLPSLGAYERAAAAEMSKLTPPASIANDWKQIVAGAHTIAESIVKLGKDSASNNSRAGQAILSELTTVRQQISSIAHRQSLKECARL
jgi:hypothetical protein